ncbi:G-protein coupled receptor family C group 6 member A-like [Megalops cyprinoides]|uniref:G-protein coupled receptor family C group 6 member A-like n=1 Tax=Megalops cyprinoides TaxID=118141 RepID=UPI001864F306|nr:G-protein coupled receptor family C group 6 member A-like [Megalops cyprinoides]
MWLFALLFLTRLCVMSADHPCSIPGGPDGVCGSGDIIIGGLFPVHTLKKKSNDTKSPLSVTCAGYDIRMFLRTQAMTYSIEVINRSPILPNLTLGYEMYDTCADVTMAIRAALRLMEDRGHAVQDCYALSSEYTASEKSVKAVIGERHSEVSIAVARLFALPLLPQISYSSTSELLSRKHKFPSFLRTVPSDAHQTRAIVQLAKKLNWESMGVIGSDDEYGKYGVERIIDYMNNDVCLDFKKILSSNFSVNGSQTRVELNELMGTIKNSTAEAIVIFTKDSNARIILEEAARLGVNRTWVASDAWSTSIELAGLKDIQQVGRVIGFTAKRNKVPGFKEYVRNFTAHSFANNSFFQKYLSLNPACSRSSDDDALQNCSIYDTVDDSENSPVNCVNIQCVTEYIDEDESYSIYLAVNVIAHALHSLLKCNDVRCERNTTFYAWELLEEIKHVNFTLDNLTNIAFDQNGDPTIGYEILGWEMNGDKTEIVPIGEYKPSGVIALRDDLVREYSNVTETVFGCFKSCPRGHQLVAKGNLCCKACDPCEKKQFSKGGKEQCQACSQTEYVSPERHSCLKKAVVYLEWTDGFAIVLVVFGVIGGIFILLVTILFVRNRDTPIVKGAGGYCCFLVLFSLFASFGSLCAFIGRPSEISCRVGLPLFVIAFTICVSCILANLYQIFVGFKFDSEVGDRLKRFNKPVVIVTACTSIQVALCALWLSLTPPFQRDNFGSEDFILIECSKGSNAMFGTTLGYIALLAVICFLFGFKGKRLPDLYKNSSFITISMLIYLVVWILFIPVYINTSGKYVQAIEATAMLVSNYSILCCHFGPKCYLIIFRKEINDENVITEHIRKHYENKGISVVNPKK